MLSIPPRASDLPTADADAMEPPLLEAPEYLVQRYLELAAQRRQIDDQLAYVRAELEMLAVHSLSEASPRGRFASGSGTVVARLQPTCVFDRAEVARALQREGRLSEVATVNGPSLARFLAKEPALAARLADLVRYRRSVVLTTA